MFNNIIIFYLHIIRWKNFISFQVIYKYNVKTINSKKDLFYEEIKIIIRFLWLNNEKIVNCLCWESYKLNH